MKLENTAKHEWAINGYDNKNIHDGVGSGVEEALEE